MNNIYWIAEYIASCTELFLCLIFCSTIIEKENYKNDFAKRFFISIIISVIMIAINKTEIYSPVTAVAGIVLMASGAVIMNRKYPLKSIILSIIFLFIITIIDNIVVSSISFGLNIPTIEIYKEMSFYRFIAVICSKTILILFTAFLNKILMKKKYMSPKYIFILFMITIIMFGLTLSIMFIDIKNNFVNSYISILFFIVMFILIMTIFLGTFKLAEYYETQQQLNLVELKNKMLEQSLSETEQTFLLWKTSIHDFKHKIMNLMTLADNNDITGIKSYLETENNLLGKKLFYYITGNETVDAILYIKQKIAESYGIAFIINAKITERCPVTSEHFASVLGNLLDNAIEACEKEENPFIEVRINEIGEYFWIIVSNKCTNPDVSLNTSKKNKYMHGIGLNSVKHIVKNYSGDIEITTVDQKFDVRIMIPLNENPA